MKKIILALAVIFISMATTQAQKKTVVSIAVNAGIPTTTVYSFAVGGDLQADFAATAGLKITLSGGYENISVKSSFGGGSAGIVPLLAGAKFNLGSEKVYGHAQLGYSVGTAKGSTGSFTYAPSIGYYFSPNFDASIKYWGFDGFGIIGARFAYNF
jgi:hypothetical protein